MKERNCENCIHHTADGCSSWDCEFEAKDLISRSDAMGAVQDHFNANGFKGYDDGQKMMDRIKALPSADAEPKWNCTANFVAEQLDRLRNMTDEERWEFFIKFFSPSADAVQGEWVDMEILCNPYSPVFCVECSRCGYRVGRETFLENTFNFCPNCGAKMKGGAE